MPWYGPNTPRTMDLCRAKVISRLGEGYGSEDIAALDGMPLNIVRQIIRKLKRDGYLDQIIDGARRKHLRKRVAA